MTERQYPIYSILNEGANIVGLEFVVYELN